MRDGCVAEVSGNVHVLGNWHYYPSNIYNITPCTIVSSEEGFDGIGGGVGGVAFLISSIF